jgi:transposase
MYKIPKKNYTVEFKQEAVRQVEIEGKSPAQVARELGIAEQTLSNWRKAAKAGKLSVGKAVTPEQMEVSRQKAENARLKMELEIVKNRPTQLPAALMSRNCGGYTEGAQRLWP